MKQYEDVCKIIDKYINKFNKQHKEYHTYGIHDKYSNSYKVCLKRNKQIGMITDNKDK